MFSTPVIFTVFAFTLFPTAVAEAKTLKCDFNMFGAPFATTYLYFDDQMIMNPTAELEHYGSKVTAEVKAVAPATGQWLSVVFDEEDPSRILKQTVAAMPTVNNTTNGVLTNPAALIGKDLPGTCAMLE